jgi:hypothetical protein
MAAEHPNSGPVFEWLKTKWQLYVVWFARLAFEWSGINEPRLF